MSVSTKSRIRFQAVDLNPIKKLMLQTCGHIFENEREQALSAGLCRRMAILDIEELEAYHSLLLCDQTELLRLTELLTVNETYFFREPEHLNMMVTTLLPEIMATHSQRPIRILSAGCSTGEEPYSIAIMLRERFGDESERLCIITGVDIDSTAITTAKKGVYGKSSFRGGYQFVFENSFTPCEQGKYRISDSIRKQVEFKVVNLLGDSYPQQMHAPDIILYRNVSIYFSGQVQREIFGKLAGLLAVGGCLLVGASETIHHDTGVLSLVQQDALFFYRKTAPTVCGEFRLTNRFSSISDREQGMDLQTKPLSTIKPQVSRERVIAEHDLELPDNRPQTTSSLRLNPRELFDTALELAHNKQSDKALAILEAIIAQDCTFEAAYCLKGSLLMSVSRYDEAHTVCGMALKHDPYCLEAYLMLGIIARQKGNYDDAIKRFREAIYLNASCWPAHFYSAEICYARDDHKRARGCYEAAVRILENGSLLERSRGFYPLSFNAEQFIIICRHKLSLLTPSDGKQARL